MCLGVLLAYLVAEKQCASGLLGHPSRNGTSRSGCLSPRSVSTEEGPNSERGFGGSTDIHFAYCSIALVLKAAGKKTAEYRLSLPVIYPRPGDPLIITLQISIAYLPHRMQDARTHTSISHHFPKRNIDHRPFGRPSHRLPCFNSKSVCGSTIPWYGRLTSIVPTGNKQMKQHLASRC